MARKTSPLSVPEVEEPAKPEQPRAARVLIAVLDLLALLDDTEKQRVLNSAASYFQVKEPWER